MNTSRVKYAALCVTHDCNLRCRYCYAGDKFAVPMTAETARQAIDFLADQADGACIITFFGGEPLLEYDLIHETVLYSRRRHGRRIGFRMSTNGTLLRPDMLAFMKEQDIYFVLSIDGGQEQHDRCRRYADDRGSYKVIADRLDDVLAFNPYTIAVSVVVPETVQFLADGVKDLFLKGFRYILQTLDYSAAWNEQDLKRMKRHYLDLAEYYIDRLSAGDKIYYSPFDERIKTWAQKPYGKGDLCDLANSQVAIAASGRIYPCVQFIGSDDGRFRENVIGDVFSGFDDARRDYFIEENYRDKQSCAGCPLHGRCATFCGCVNWRATGRLDTIPPIICAHERMLIPIVDKLANRLWKKNVALFKRKFYEKTFPISSYIEDCFMTGRGADAQDQTG